MNVTDLLGMVLQGEGSSVEFKRDGVRPASLASEMVALLNLDGGHILLGVEDNGTVHGLVREPRKVEEWVMEVARTHVQPAWIPHFEALEMDPGHVVGVISIPRFAPDKPYKAKRGAHWITRVRVGSTSRDATREEEQRLFQASGGLRYGLKPVTGTRVDDLDQRRLADYLGRVIGGEQQNGAKDLVSDALLANLEFATDVGGLIVPTVDGMLLFGLNPGRFLPQSGIRAICYQGSEPDYAARADENIKGPLVSLGSRDVPMMEPGIVDRAWDFVLRNTEREVCFEGARRWERLPYPEPAVREVLVNALVHRDYTITGTDVTLSIFSDRLEIESPGRLPNNVTVERMKAGLRYARNQTLVNVMRDYNYVEARGMGIRNKVIPLMRAHNGTEPELLDEEYRFTVRLWSSDIRS
jgi:ATP-dependent DNA helicase RecG